MSYFYGKIIIDKLLTVRNNQKHVDIFGLKVTITNGRYHIQYSAQHKTTSKALLKLLTRVDDHNDRLDDNYFLLAFDSSINSISTKVKKFS